MLAQVVLKLAKVTLAERWLDDLSATCLKINEKRTEDHAKFFYIKIKIVVCFRKI